MLFLYLSLTLILFLSLSLSHSLFLQLHLSLSPTTCRVCSRRVEERSSRVRLRYVRSVSSQSVQLFRSVSTCRNPSIIDETNLFKRTPFALGSRLLCRRASKTVLPPFGADLKLNLVLKFDCGTCPRVGESNCCNYISQTVLRAHKNFFESSDERGKELRTSVQGHFCARVSKEAARRDKIFLRFAVMIH